MKEYSCLELYQTNLMKFSYILGGKKCFKYKLNIYVNIYFMDLEIIDIFNLVLLKKIIMIPPLKHNKWTHDVHFLYQIIKILHNVIQ
jgi:hypothetical protein